MTTVASTPKNPLRDVVQSMARLLADHPSEDTVLAQGKELMRSLLGNSDWLPHELTLPHPEFYSQYLLYADPLGRFSVVSFVWGPGQQTPVHNHTVWGIIGMLSGAEYSQGYKVTDSGALEPSGAEHLLQPGDVEVVSPSLGDIHRVRNAHSDQTSISIHMYGGNIGEIKRHVFDPVTGAQKGFVSGYSNAMVPNLWRAPA
jgi:3-mercaptopropionate dioxygenase